MNTHSRHRQGSKNAQGGFVLVTILWMLAILTVLILGFGQRAMLERRMAWYDLDKAQAQAMARGAAQRALLELNNQGHINNLHQQMGYTGLDQQWARPVDLLRESDYFQLSTEDEFAEDICIYQIEDCERFISINHAPRELLESLEVFDFITIDALLDYRIPKKDSQRVPFFDPEAVFDLDGAESIDERAWYGTDDEAGVVSLMTVYGDDGRINVNTASREVLAMIPKISDSTLDAIFAYRNGPDEEPNTADDRAFKSIRAMRKELSTSFEAFGPLQKYCKTDSQWFKITAHATRRRGKINAYYTVIVEKERNNVVVRHWKEGIVAQ